MQAFFDSKPSDLDTRELSPDILKGSEDRFKGYPDDLYAFDMQYATWKSERKPQDGIPTEIYQAAVKIKPVAGDAQKRKKQLRKWMKKRAENHGFTLDICNAGDDNFGYLAAATRPKGKEAKKQKEEVAKVTRPAVSNGMIKPLLQAMHESSRCMGKTELAAAFNKAFHTQRYSSQLVLKYAQEVQMGCAICRGVLPLPKKATS